MVRKAMTLLFVMSLGAVFLRGTQVAAAQSGSSDCATLNASTSGPGDLTFVSVVSGVSLKKGELLILTTSNPTNPILNAYLQVNGSLVNQASGPFHGAVGLLYTIPADGSYDIVAGSLIMALGAGNSPSTYTVTCETPATTPSGTKTHRVIRCPLFTDGRLNNCDAAQTVAIYCQKDGGVAFYSIETSKGSKLFTISGKDINAVPKNPEINTLITEQQGVLLYRLTSGELQVMRPESHTGKYYQFIFRECPNFTAQQ